MDLKDLHEGLAKRTYAKRRIQPVARIYQYHVGAEEDLTWQMMVTVVKRLEDALKSIDPNVLITHKEDSGGGENHSVFVRVPESIKQRKIEQTIEEVVETTKNDYERYQE